VIEDKDEYERAIKARSTALSAIRRECQSTTFGLLCPEQHEGALDAAIAKARAIVEEHNATAVHTRVSVYALKGRVASNDAEAARAITSELAGLVVQMQRGIETVDAASIRDAANKAREMSAMLDDSLKGKIDGAIAQARKAARDITRRIEKNAEDKAIVLADIQRGQIESARIAFLDLSEAAPVEALPAIDAQRFADLDVDADDDADESTERAPVGPGKRQAIPKIDLAEGSEPVTMSAPSAARMMGVG
jgi:hypothetical protein